MIVKKIRSCIQNFNFGQGRRTAKLQERFRKDFTSTQAIQIQFQREQKDNLNNDNIVQLSDALDQAQKSVFDKQHFTLPSKQKLNLHIRKTYKDSIDQNIPLLVEQVKESLEDQTLKWQENRIIGDEAKKFSKVYFRKKETNRLQLNESKRPSNYLPVKDLLNEGESLLAELNQKNNTFQSSIHQLQDQRLSGLTNKKIYHNDNINQYLTESGMLNLQEPIKIKILNLLSQIINEQSGYQQNQKALINPITKGVDQIVSEMIQLVGIQNEISEIHISKFVNSIMIQTNFTNQQVEEHLITTSQIDNYQKFLFQQFHDNDINFRYQGRLEFWMLNEEEQLKYIKFNIRYPDIILKAVKTFIQYENISNSIYPQLMQQLSTFKPTSFIQYLGIIQDKRFSLLLKQVSLSLNKLDDETFASTIFAISKMHPRSQAVVYKKLCVKFYHNLIQEFFSRIDYISTTNLALIVRNLHNYSFTQNFAIQLKIAQKIQLNCKDINSLNIYQSESFLKFLSSCSSEIMIQFKTTAISLIERLSTFAHSTESQIQQFDLTTLSIFSHAILQVQNIDHHVNFCQLVQLIDVGQLILKSEPKDVVQFLTMLAAIDFPKKHPLISIIKKKLVEVISLKNHNIYDEEISQIMASLSKIDHQSLFKGYQIYEKLHLQSCFSHQIFSPNSPQYIPYTKMIKAIDSKSKLQILKSLTLMNHPNRPAISNIIYSLIGYEPSRPTLQNDFDVDLKTIASILQVYSVLNFRDEIFPKLLSQGIEQFSLNYENSTIKFETILQIMQTIFCFNIKCQMKFIIELSKALKSSLYMFQNEILTTFQVFSLFYLITIIRRKNITTIPSEIKKVLDELIINLKKKTDTLNEDIDSTINPTSQQEINYQQKFQTLTYEQQYLLQLCRQLGQDMNFKNINQLPNMSTSEIKRFIDYSQKVNNLQVQNIGTERFQKLETQQKIIEDLKNMGHRIESDKYLTQNEMIYDKVDITIDGTQHIKLLSLSQMIDNAGEYQLRGLDGVLQLLTPSLKFILIEEYNRVSENQSESSQVCQEFLKQYTKQLNN